MRLYIIIFLALNFVSLASYSQTPLEPERGIEVFKEKLQEYYEKNSLSIDYPIPVKHFDSTRHNMLIANVKSFMIDEEIGLAYEFATQKIYDTETKLVYLIEEKKIYDPKTNTFYQYKLSTQQ